MLPQLETAEETVSRETFTVFSPGCAGESCPVREHLHGKHYAIRFDVTDIEPWNWTVSIYRGLSTTPVETLTFADSDMHWLAQWINGHEG